MANFCIKGQLITERTKMMEVMIIEPIKGLIERQLRSEGIKIERKINFVSLVKESTLSKDW